jgi:hypothetical protein
MKRSQISTLIALVALCALALGLAAGWLAAWLAAYAGNPVVFWSGLVIILAVVAVALRLMHRFTRAFLRDVRRLSEAGRLVLDANPDYRIRRAGTPRHPDAHTGLQPICRPLRRVATSAHGRHHAGARRSGGGAHVAGNADGGTERGRRRLQPGWTNSALQPQRVSPARRQRTGRKRRLRRFRALPFLACSTATPSPTRWNRCKIATNGAKARSAPSSPTS